MRVFAADLGGTQIKLGIVETGTILCSMTLDAHSEGDLRDRLPEIERNFRDLLRQCGLSLHKIQGIGFLSTGLVDRKSNRILSTNHKFDDAAQIDFTAWAKERFDLPIKLENDAHAALLGEWKYGAGAGCDNLVMIALGTGIGTSVLIQGKPLRGKNGQAGLLGGHLMMDPSGRSCTCPSRGCPEALASTWALPMMLRDRPECRSSPWAQDGAVDFRSLFQWADRQDAQAQKILNYSLRIWGAVAVSMIHLFAPDKIVLGGGIMRSAERILPFIQEWVNRHAWISWNGVEVVSAQHLTSAGLLGAEILFHEDIEYI
ncbi:MAG: ROK family protein [Candidatus Omnitrophota bacterium]